MTLILKPSRHTRYTWYGTIGVWLILIIGFTLYLDGYEGIPYSPPQVTPPVTPINHTGEKG